MKTTSISAHVGCFNTKKRGDHAKLASMCTRNTATPSVFKGPFAFKYL